jgi:hypothetical protein
MTDISNQLTERIIKRISTIPASNPMMIEAVPDTLSSVLSRALIRKIAEEAVEETGEYLKEVTEALVEKVQNEKPSN